MKGGARVAMGVGVGYLLGRTRKMRLALMVAAAGATGTLGGSPRELLQRGLKQLSSSPELGKITESVRGELLDAAKAAAVTAASSRIESLSDRIGSGGVSGRSAEESDEEQKEPEQEEYEDELPPEQAEEGYAEEEPEEPEEQEEPERPAARRRRAAATSPRTRRRRPAEAQEDDDEEPATRPRRTTRATASTGRAPVRRTRR